MARSFGRELAIGTGKVLASVGGAALGGAIGAYIGGEMGIAFSPEIHQLSWLPPYPPINLQEGFGIGFLGGLGILFGGTLTAVKLSSRRY